MEVILEPRFKIAIIRNCELVVEGSMKCWDFQIVVGCEFMVEGPVKCWELKIVIGCNVVKWFVANCLIALIHDHYCVTHFIIL